MFLANIKNSPYLLFTVVGNMHMTAIQNRDF